MGRLTPEQREAICSAYVTGRKTGALCAEYGISSVGLRGLLKRRGIARSAASDAARLYTAEERFFSCIEQESQAYWLGFLAADAQVDSRGMVVLSLAERDRDHIERFRDALRSTHPIKTRTYPTHSYASLLISSKPMVRDLCACGVTPRKTFTLVWPTTMPPELLRHFLRGYVDGDGGFTLSRTAFPRPNVTFHVTSNLPFLQAAQQFLIDSCALGMTSMYRRHGDVPIYTLRYCGRVQVLRIARFLYEDSTVFLPRKQAIIQLLSA